jgi:hypothetical protein
MVMDAYDLNHNREYKYTLTINGSDRSYNDVVDTFVSQFNLGSSIYPNYSEKIRNEILKQIEHLKQSMYILDFRNITSIGARLCFVSNDGREEWIHILYFRR